MLTAFLSYCSQYHGHLSTVLIKSNHVFIFLNIIDRVIIFCTSYVPRVPQFLSPRPNGDPPPHAPPLPQASVFPPPPFNQRGRNTLACGRGDGGSQFGRLEKTPSTLSTLCFAGHKTLRCTYMPLPGDFLNMLNTDYPCLKGCQNRLYPSCE
jgi:hypothetical protein